MKRIITLILAAAMVLAMGLLTPVSVMAEDTDVSIDYSALGYENSAELPALTVSGISITYDKGSNSNAPKYYDKGTSARFYNGNTFTMSVESGSIKKVVFTATSAEYAVELGADSGSVAVEEVTVTWTGSASAIVFTNASGGQFRPISMVITKSTDAPTGGDSGTGNEGNDPTGGPDLSTDDKIVDALYALESGAKLDGDNKHSLTGVISKINTAYADPYITVTIVVNEKTDKPVQCYKMKAASGVEGIANLAVGDKIKVEGILKDYRGTKEFDKDCELVAILEKAPEVEPLDLSTEEKIIEALFKLGEGETLSTDKLTLTGVIEAVNTNYSETNKNITVTITVCGKSVQCFRMKAAEGVEGLDKLAVGDKIKVKGILKDYRGTKEFDAGCELVEILEKAPEVAPLDLSTPEKILEEVYKLGNNESLRQEGPVELTGVITKINTPWDDGFKNITVTIVINNIEDKPIECYRLKASADVTEDDIKGLATGDKITVSGYLKDYNGKKEFDANCELKAVVEKSQSEPEKQPETAQEIVDKIYSLEDGDTFSGATYRLSGTVTKVDTAYNDEYKNVSVTIVVDGIEDAENHPVMIYRLTGENLDALKALKVGDQITVTGTALKNYHGTFEISAGSTLVAYNPTGNPGTADPTGMIVASVAAAAVMITLILRKKENN